MSASTVERTSVLAWLPAGGEDHHQAALLRSHVRHRTGVEVPVLVVDDLRGEPDHQIVVGVIPRGSLIGVPIRGLAPAFPDDMHVRREVHAA